MNCGTRRIITSENSCGGLLLFFFYYFIFVPQILRRVLKMDLCILSSVLSIMYTCILHTAAALPAAEAPAAAAAAVSASPAAPAPQHHLRTKRCSCATFLDNECVYFCHLDIIWVNTPERVVSYGLGSAPRAKRAVAESMATSSGPRCRCSRREDDTCRRFCHLRMWKGGPHPRLPPAPRTSASTRLVRRRHHRVNTSRPPFNPGAQTWVRRQP